MESKDEAAEAGSQASLEQQASIHKASSPPAFTQAVALRLEVATKGQALLLQAAIWTMVILLTVLAIGAVAAKSALQQSATEVRDPGYHIAVVAIAATCLTIEVFIAVVFAYRVRQSIRDKLVWSRRHVAIAVDGAVSLSLEIIISTFWLAPNATVLAADCIWPLQTVTAFQMVRDIASVTLVIWFLIAMHSLQRYQRPEDGMPAGPASSSLQGVSGGRLAAQQADSGGHANQGFSAPTRHTPGLIPAEQRQGEQEPQLQEEREQQQQQQQQQSPELHSPEGFSRPLLSSEAGAAASNGAAFASAEFPAATQATKAPYWSAAAAAGHELLMDSPWQVQLRVHAPKIAMWIILTVLTMLNGVRQLLRELVVAIKDSCVPASSEGGDPVIDPGNTCGLNTAARIGELIKAILVVSYFAIYILYQHRALRDHRSLPYTKYRMTNLYLRVQVVNSTVVLTAVLLTMLVGYSMSSTGSCWSYLEGQLGDLPPQLAVFVLAVSAGILYMPVRAGGASVLQAWLQEFAWTEQSLPEDIARRTEQLRQQLEQADGGLHMPGMMKVPVDLVQGLAEELAPNLAHTVEQAAGSVARHAQRVLDKALTFTTGRVSVEEVEARLAAEPMLCIETAIRSFYWARLAYEIGPTADPSSPINERTALELLGLQHTAVLLELATETLGVVGWGGPGCRHIVLSFRGTANMQNVLTDIKFWKTLYEPKRRWRGLAVRVHSGFYAAWRGGDFNSRVLAKVEEVVGSLQVATDQLSFLVTGHSLGGALATLCAYEVQRKWPTAKLEVYTYGAPRVGNAAWAGDYNRCVPHTWMLIDNEDPVPRVPKGLFKRVGNRVMVTPQGDILVRPSHFEMTVLTKSGGTVKDHLTGTYALAIGAVLKAQFNPTKCLPGGEEGVCELVTRLDLGRALALTNLDLDSLRDPAAIPIPVEEAMRRAKTNLRLGSRKWIACCGNTDHHEHAEVVSPRVEKEVGATADAHTGGMAARAGGEIHPAAPAGGSATQLDSTTVEALAS